MKTALMKNLRRIATMNKIRRNNLSDAVDSLEEVISSIEAAIE